MRGEKQAQNTPFQRKSRVWEKREQSRVVVPSSWEEGLGVVEKNNDITYYRATINNRSNLICRYHPLPLLPDGGDNWQHLYNHYSFLALSRFGKSIEFEIQKQCFRECGAMSLKYERNELVLQINLFCSVN